ncbi:MAG: hypothetical protein ACPL88_12355 [Bryobacteraceae bacterium]
MTNGMIQTSPAPFPSVAFSTLAMPGGLPPGAGAITQGGDRTTVDWAALKQNALRLQKPELGSQAACCNAAASDGGVPAAVFTLEILVGEEGKVREVKYAGAQQPDSLDRVMEAARGWEFRPFLVDGKPRTLTARIPFTITRAGQVFSPVF